MSYDDDVQGALDEGPHPIRLAALGLITLVAVIFVLSNLDSTQVSFIGWDFEMPLFLLLVIAVLVGALLGQAAMVLWRRSRD